MWMIVITEDQLGAYFKRLEEDQVKLTYDKSSDSICINNVPATTAALESLSLYKDLMEKYDDSDLVHRILLRIAKFKARTEAR